MVSANYTERAGLAKQMLSWRYILAMPRSMLRISTYVYTRMLIFLVHGGVYHATTGNGKPCLSFFLFEGNDRYNEQEKYTRGMTTSLKKELLRFHIFSYVYYVIPFQEGFPLVGTCGSNTRVKNFRLNSQN